MAQPSLLTLKLYIIPPIPTAEKDIHDFFASTGLIAVRVAIKRIQLVQAEVCVACHAHTMGGVVLCRAGVGKDHRRRPHPIPFVGGDRGRGVVRGQGWGGLGGWVVDCGAGD